MLPAPTTYDLVDGQVVATNVQPTPEPVAGQIEWAYEVTFKDRHGKTFSFLVGVPDSTTQVNFISLPRYFETKPPLFGQGPKGDPGESATVAVGTVSGGTEASVTNSGTNADAVLDFVLPQGPQGPPGTGVTVDNNKLFSDPPTSYNVGVTTTNATAGNGWPVGFLTVTTEVARSTDRVVQTMVNVSQSFYAQRVAQDGAWNAIKQVAYADVATTTANGLMSSADKSKLNGIGTLAYKSKISSDAPNTYPEGVSVGVMAIEDGWPLIEGSNTGFITVKTDMPRQFSTVTQFGYAYKNTTELIAQDSPIIYRQGYDSLPWGDWQTLAKDNESIVRQGALGYSSDFLGAEGNGTTNDYFALQTAITTANGKPIYLEGGKTYLIGGTLTLPAGVEDVHIEAIGTEPATLKIGGTGQSYGAINFAPSGTPITKTLTARKALGSNTGWTVTNTTGIVPGMLCEVMSSLSWYFDPRPESSDARKSELHKVSKVVGNQVFFLDQANDGYDPALETVTLKFYNPIRVHLENLLVQGTLAPPAESTPAITGITVAYADSPTLINVSTDSCAGAGIRSSLCYRPVIRGGYSRRSNDFFTGYGVQILGSAFAMVIDRHSYECRRGVDVSGLQIVSRNTRLIRCVAAGGGTNSKGNTYGWDDAGALGDPQFGFGTHGPADQTEYIECHTYGIRHPYSIRGRDERIVNMRHVGRTFGGIVVCSHGTNLFVEGGLITSGAWSYKTAAGGTTSWAGKGTRPDTLIRVYNGYQYSPPSGIQRGRVVLKGVIAELTHSIMYIQNPSPIPYPTGHLSITDCDIQVWAYSDDTFYTIYSDTDIGAWSKARTFIGPNRITNDTSSGTIALSNYSLSGANVLNYTTQA